MACAYGSTDLVAAMMKHADTPVGDLGPGLLSQHSSLTFLASHLTDPHRARTSKFFDSSFDFTRQAIFNLLISDARTPVNYRYDTYDGGRTLDVLGFLKDHNTVAGLAYFPTVSRLLWQRQAAIATSPAYRHELQTAFMKATDALLEHDSFRSMSVPQRRDFCRDIGSLLDQRLFQAARYAHGETHGFGPRQSTNASLDLRSLELESIAPHERRLALSQIGTQAWESSASATCLKAGLYNIFGRPNAPLAQLSTAIDRHLRP